MSDEEKKMTSDRTESLTSKSEIKSSESDEPIASSEKNSPLPEASPLSENTDENAASDREKSVGQAALQSDRDEKEEGGKATSEVLKSSSLPEAEAAGQNPSILQNSVSRVLDDQSVQNNQQSTPVRNDKVPEEPDDTNGARGKADAKKIKVKPSRSKVARNPLIILGNFFLMLVIVIILAITIPIYVGKNMFVATGPQSNEQVVLINQGAGIREIASILEKQGLIRSADIFVYGVGYQDKARLLKAGEYAIPAHASMKDIMDILVEGKSIEHAFTVPEGLTVAQVFDRLAANDVLVGSLPKVLPPEGSLMANTVNFIRGTTREQIVKRLRDGQQKLVADIWAKRAPDLPIKNINEFVTLASIVEKETGIATERPQVAAVFYNRLAKNMRLQSDPTVIYGLFGGKGKPSDRPIYQSDLDKDTPYNTYKINGLPPTPIANPGRDALEAVANPPKSDALYFVADGTGGHVFSKTLDEHNANVRKWRAMQKND